MHLPSCDASSISGNKGTKAVTAKEPEQPEDQSQYHWWAFCYLHGELDAEEQRRWEQLLVEDERARKVFVEVMELTEAARHVFHQATLPVPTVMRERSRRPLVRTIGLALGTVAAGVLLAVGLWRVEFFSPSKRAPTSFASATPALAEAWFEAYQISNWDSAIGQVQGVDATADAGQTLRSFAAEVAADSEPFGLADAEVAAPGWLMLAVAEYHGKSIDGESRKTEGQP